MDECIDNGTIPSFGYPLVTFSPVGSKERKKGEFWWLMYKSMLTKGAGKNSTLIGQLLDHYDEF